VAPAVVALALALALAGCGVEVDAAAPTTSATTATTLVAPPVPPSDDALVNMLERNGYSRDEATCGAEQLRDQLSSDEVDSLVDAQDLTDIDPTIADEFGSIMSDCLD